MEETGVLVDRKMLAEAKQRARQGRWQSSKRRAHELAGGPFNLGSPKQLQQILFEQQELPVIRKTPEGTAVDGPKTCSWNLRTTTNCRPSSSTTAASSKLKSTYTDKLPLHD